MMQLWQREVEEEAERMGNELERDDERQKREAQRGGPRRSPSTLTSMSPHRVAN